MERTLKVEEQAYKNLKAVAAMLEALSPNNARYEVRDVYLDFGAKWMWTTICRRGFSECQVLSPRDWQEIEIATTPAELAAIVEKIRNDKYFGDKEVA